MGVVPQSQTDPRRFVAPEVRSRIEELARRVTNKTMERVGERIALTKNWVLDKLVENVEKAMTAKSGSSVANRALELLGTELGMFRNDGPVKPSTLDDLSTEDLERMVALGTAAADAQPAEGTLAPPQAIPN